MDAESLDLEIQSFDAVLSMFALLHFPNPLAAVKEMFRVLRPGGTVVVAVGSGPSWRSWSGWLHRFRRLVGVLAECRGRQLIAPAFLDQLGIKHLPSSDRTGETSWAVEHPNRTRILPRLMREAGFVDLYVEWHGRIAEVESADEFWDVQVTFSSISRKHLGDAPPGKIATLREDFNERCCCVQARGGRLVFPCGAFFVKGTRPWTHHSFPSSSQHAPRRFAPG